MDTYMIGSKIVKARKKMNMSQAKLAELLFISPQAVGKWERGESIPDIITFNRLSQLLGVDLNYFSEQFHSSDNETDSSTTIVDSRGVKQPLLEVNDISSSSEKQLVTNFNGSNLTRSDFTGITAHKMKYNGSVLFRSDFSNADLTGSSFETCDAREAIFASTNLTDCNFSITDLKDANFSKCIFVRTTLNMSGQGTKFTDVNFTDVKLIKTDLRKTIFENCIFNSVEFYHCDLRETSFDGQVFNGVKFDMSALNNASFQDATLKNVSFRATLAITNRYYRAIKTIVFDGAMIDKLTYASLKGLGADLSKATVI